MMRTLLYCPLVFGVDPTQALVPMEADNPIYPVVSRLGWGSCVVGHRTVAELQRAALPTDAEASVGRWPSAPLVDMDCWTLSVPKECVVWLGVKCTGKADDGGYNLPARIYESADEAAADGRTVWGIVQRPIPTEYVVSVRPMVDVVTGKCYPAMN